MKIPILDLKRQYDPIKRPIKKAIDGVVAAQDFVLGKELARLEEEIAAYCSTKYAVGVASGTDALILSLKALGVGGGDEVITTPFTFFATAEAVSAVGARPVFADIDPRTYNIDAALIEEKITGKTKAIIPVHLYGQCADMDPIIDIARRRGVKIIEDAAQAIGAGYKNRPAGSIGDAGALSFFPSKNLGAFGDAGMVVTGDKALADKIRLLRVHGSSTRYIHSDIGMNSRLDNIQAAVLRVKLRYLDKWLDRRRAAAARYDKSLKGLPLVIPAVAKWNTHTYHLYVIRVPGARDRLAQLLSENGIEARAYYPVPLHLQDCYKGLGYKKGDFKAAEAAAEETLAIPLFAEMRKGETDHVVRTIKRFFKIDE